MWLLHCFPLLPAFVEKVSLLVFHLRLDTSWQQWQNIADWVASLANVSTFFFFLTDLSRFHVLANLYHKHRNLCWKNKVCQFMQKYYSDIFFFFNKHIQYICLALYSPAFFLVWKNEYIVFLLVCSIIFLSNTCCAVLDKSFVIEKPVL